MPGDALREADTSPIAEHGGHVNGDVPAVLVESVKLGDALQVVSSDGLSNSTDQS